MILLELSQHYDQQADNILQQQAGVVRKQQAMLHRLKEKPVLTRKQMEKQELLVQQLYQGKGQERAQQQNQMLALRLLALHENLFQHCLQEVLLRQYQRRDRRRDAVQFENVLHVWVYWPFLLE